MAKTKLMPKSWIPAGPYSLGTQLGNFAFLSGQIATANDGSVIGGSDVFVLFEPQAERIELTQIHADYEGDTFMDAPDESRWKEVAREDHEASGDTPAFSFITYERRT